MAELGVGVRVWIRRSATGYRDELMPACRLRTGVITDGPFIGSTKLLTKDKPHWVTSWTVRPDGSEHDFDIPEPMLSMLLLLDGGDTEAEPREAELTA